MPRSFARLLLAASSAGLLMAAGPETVPPVAPRKDHAQVWHGRTFVDPYYWLREKGSPDVVTYLEAENAYTEATTADLKPFSEALYKEMLGRIKQTDLSVPTRDGRFYYYRRTVEGLQYPIRCRKPAGPDGAFRDDAAGGGAPRPERDGEGPGVPLGGRLRGERRRPRGSSTRPTTPASGSTSCSSRT